MNDLPIFLKGSNWIPSHVLPEAMNTQMVQQLLRDAVSTHQNTIRVWGGGVYESEEFYQVSFLKLIFKMYCWLRYTFRYILR